MASSQPELTTLQRELLEAFFERESGFFLSGGAALVGFYLHHRETEDLDLFTVEGASFERGAHVLADAVDDLGATMVARQQATGFHRYFVSRGEQAVIVDLVLDLVDVMALERAGFAVKDALEGALAKDGGCTPATLAWVLSEIEIPDQVELPGGISVKEMREYLEQLIRRLRRAAAPEL